MLTSTEDSTAHTYRYAEVASVHRKGMSTGTKIGVGVVAVIAVVSIIAVRSIRPI